MRKKRLVVLLAVVILFVASIMAIIRVASMEIYWVRDASGATVFWKDDEAYLFLGSGHTGYRISYLEYPLEIAKEYFYVVPSPNDQRVIGTVIRVMPSGVERHVVEYGENAAQSALLLTPFDDGFYGMCQGGVLCKWTGHGFEVATQEEQEKHGGTDRLFRGDFNGQIINGWSAREVRRMPGDHFEAKVDDKFVIAAKNQASDVRERAWISVDLIRPGRPPERLYNVNGTPRLVSKTEYQNIFGSR